MTIHGVILRFGALFAQRRPQVPALDKERLVVQNEKQEEKEGNVS